MQIRLAKADEYDRYAAVMGQLTEAQAAALPDILYVPKEDPKKHGFEQSFKEDENLLIFAEEDDKVLGVLEAEIRKQGENEHTVMRKRRTLHILDIVVDKDARKKGVGRALLDHATAWGKERGAVDSTLHVFAFNKDAIEFYKMLGYETLELEMRKIL